MHNYNIATTCIKIGNKGFHIFSFFSKNLQMSYFSMWTMGYIQFCMVALFQILRICKGTKSCM